MTAGQNQANPPAGGGITAAMQAHLAAQLEPGEQVLWAGATDVAGRMKKITLLMAISCLFLVLLCGGVFLTGAGPNRGLLVALSVLGPAALFAFVYWGGSADFRRTFYAVTDRRALLLKLGKPRQTQSFPPDKIQYLHIKRWKSGRGTLYFGKETGRDMDGHKTTMHYGFDHIAGVDQVADLMRQNFGPLGD